MTSKLMQSDESLFVGLGFVRVRRGGGRGGGFDLVVFNVTVFGR
jgi:hypothetical protein